MSIGPGPQRIGEFARRVGVSPELLRAWESRYGLFHPLRSPGGFRLYDDDAGRAARMRRALDEGLSAAEPRASRSSPTRLPPDSPDDAAARLLDAIGEFDERTVQAVLDECFTAFGVEAVLRDLILPTLAQVGRDWKKSQLGISQEHFASNLIRGRLISLAQFWGRGGGSLALLACPPGEEHDISLVAFGLLLRSHGWRVLFLGANTPIAALAQTITMTSPAITVLTSFDEARYGATATPLRRLARTTPLMLSGPGASEAICRRLGARRLDGDLIDAAHAIALSPRA